MKTKNDDAQNNCHCCDSMRRALTQESLSIIYLPKFREYGVPILDGGSSFQEIQFCPWCGEKLPESLRDKWFDELEQLELEPGDEKVPKQYLSDQWWSLTAKDS